MMAPTQTVVKCPQGVSAPAPNLLLHALGLIPRGKVARATVCDVSLRFTRHNLLVGLPRTPDSPCIGHLAKGIGNDGASNASHLPEQPTLDVHVSRC